MQLNVIFENIDPNVVKPNTWAYQVLQEKILAVCDK